MARTTKYIYILLLLLTTVLPSVYGECVVNMPDEIANKIAYGHAWTNHANEFSDKRKIANIEMPESYKISTEADFQKHIFTIITTTSPKFIPGDRKVYWDDETGTIVFYDPNSNDCGTAFRPNDGKEYYERVLKRKESDKDRSKMNMHLKNTSKQKHDYQVNRNISPQTINSPGFKCDGRIFCSEMNSCAEAMFFLKNCPNTKMDGNNDGIPCEKQWCH